VLGRPDPFPAPTAAYDLVNRLCYLIYTPRRATARLHHWRHDAHSNLETAASLLAAATDHLNDHPFGVGTFSMPTPT
jgi:hypothetical protein